MLLGQMRDINIMSRGMPWPQTGAPQYPAQLGIPDKGRATNGLVVCNYWDLEPLDLLNGQALGCYQPPPLNIRRIKIS